MRLAALLAGALALLAGTPADAQLRIVATTTDLGSLAREVGGDLVDVTVLVPAGADPESFEPKPTDALRLRGSALVVRAGLGLDFWLDRLVSEPALARGGERQVDASTGIPLLEARGRSPDAPQDGHAHGSANPHYWLDPENAVTITAAIAEALIRIDPPHERDWIANRDRFLERLASKQARWTAEMAPYAGAAVAAYHNTWPYFARRFRLNLAAIAEPKPGIAPSPAYLAGAIRAMREAGARAIIQEPFEPDDAVRLMAERTGAAVVVLAPMVGSLPAAGDYIAMIDYDVTSLAAALRGVAR
jgi:ABC-type Zn uptake system ZnuABC Zn-binding protein ZnuA